MPIILWPFFLILRKIASTMTRSSASAPSYAGSCADKPHILIVDDDDRIRALLKKYLEREDYIIISAENADEAQALLTCFEVDLIVLDVMMPGQTGLQFAHHYRKNTKQAVPILFLTALDQTEDRIAGFESGGDDYLAKPFDPRELIYRIEAILRRTKKKIDTDLKLRIGDWLYDPETKDLNDIEGRRVPLTDVENNLLKILGQHAGDLVARDVLAAHTGSDPLKRTIDVQVARLRAKLEPDSDGAARYLQTIRGKGYILRAEPVYSE